MALIVVLASKWESHWEFRSWGVEVRMPSNVGGLKRQQRVVMNDADQRCMGRNTHRAHVPAAARGSLRTIKPPELVTECTHAP